MKNDIELENNKQDKDKYNLWDIILWCLCMVCYTWLFGTFMGTEVQSSFIYFFTSTYKPLIVFIIVFAVFCFTKRRHKDYLSLVLGIYTGLMGIMILLMYAFIVVFGLMICLLFDTGISFKSITYGLSTMPFIIISVLAGLYCIARFVKSRSK